MNYENIKRNYDHGLWNDAMVKVMVRKGIITKEEYASITGKTYYK